MQTQGLPGADQLHNLGIRQQDVIEKFIRSRAPGGQHVNKTATCVYLRHVPTGIDVKSQNQRSQWANRRHAWELLLAKISAQRQAQRQQQQQLREKLRRQKRPPSAASKRRSIEYKRRLSQKKQMRTAMRTLPED